MIESYKRVHKQGIPGNFHGDGYQTGATFVLGPSPHGILYEHRQDYFGDLADEKEIVRICSKPSIIFGVYNYQQQ